MPELSTIQQIVTWILPVLLAITVHEAAHAWVANHFGDNTAKSLGRLSFNPIKHIDLIGTLIVPFATLLMSNFNFVFGWAKPVPINSRNFKNPRRDLILATAAGPLSNLLMAILWSALIKITLLLVGSGSPSSIALFTLLMGRAGVLINLLLAFLNLIPILPLDGGRIMSGLLSPKTALVYQKAEPFGFLILMLLVFTGILHWILDPFIRFSLMLLSSLFKL